MFAKRGVSVSVLAFFVGASSVSVFAFVPIRPIERSSDPHQRNNAFLDPFTEAWKNPQSFWSNIFEKDDMTTASPLSFEDDPHALATYGHWRAYLDTDTTGLVYYHHDVSGVSQWTRPRGFPTVVLSPKDERISARKQESYNKKLKSSAQPATTTEDENNNWMVLLLQGAVDQFQRVIQEYAPEEPLASEGPWKAFVARDKSDTVYYFNEETGQSQWVPPSLTFPAVHSSSSKHVVPKVKKFPGKDELLAESGPWQAFFDATNALVYYYNTLTAKGQWEAPANFPKVKLSKEQLARTKAMRNQYQVLQASSSEDNSDPFGAIGDFVSGLWQEDAEKNEKEKSTLDDMNALDFLPSLPDVSMLLDEIMFHLNLDRSLTRTVVRTPPPDVDRELDLLKKREHDSDMRQENLRRNYEEVHYERSPTFSLTAMKKDNNKEWLKYLDD